MIVALALTLAACTHAQLDVHAGRGEGAAGHVIVPLVFTNTSSRSCTLRGYPGVSSVAGAHGRMVGRAARRDRAPRRTVVLAAHGGKASALLNHLDADVVDPKVCLEASSPGYRVYAPGQTLSFFVASKHTVCTHGPYGDSIKPVVAGARGASRAARPARR